MKEEIMTKKSKSQNNKKNKEITNATIKKEELSSNALLEEEIKNLRQQLKDKDKELKETKQELYLCLLIVVLNFLFLLQEEH